MGKEEVSQYIEEIDYFFEKVSRDIYPGFHKSSIEGSGFSIKGYDTIFNQPDFTRVDWNATFSSMSRIPLVKVVEQKNSITVSAVVDGSASMGFWGSAKKMREIAKFAASIGFSAYKTGDKFGLLLLSDNEEKHFEPQFSRTYFLEIGELLWSFKPKIRERENVSDALDYLPPKPSLVFWLSDFHFSLKEIDDFAFRAVLTHDIIPVVFWDSAEFEKLPDWGMVFLYDPETGERRPELITPKRKKELQSVFLQRKVVLTDVFEKHGISPIFVLDELKPRRIAEFFLNKRYA